MYANLGPNYLSVSNPSLRKFPVQGPKHTGSDWGKGQRSDRDTDPDLKQAKRTSGSCGVAPEALVAWISLLFKTKMAVHHV